MHNPMDTGVYQNFDNTSRKQDSRVERCGIGPLSWSWMLDWGEHYLRNTDGNVSTDINASPYPHEIGALSMSSREHFGGVGTVSTATKPR
jgi:hypothetical protein